MAERGASFPKLDIYIYIYEMFKRFMQPCTPMMFLPGKRSSTGKKQREGAENKSSNQS